MRTLSCKSRKIQVVVYLRSEKARGGAGGKKQMTVALLLANPVWNFPLFILITYLQRGLKLGLRQALLSCFCGVCSLSLKLSQRGLHLHSHGEGGISPRWVLSDPLEGRNTLEKHIATAGGSEACKHLQK